MAPLFFKAVLLTNLNEKIWLNEMLNGIIKV